MGEMVTRRTVSRREDGVELVRGVFSYPEDLWDEAAEWIASAERWLDDVLFPYARTQFENDPAADKRFSFRRYEYEIAVSFVTEASETASLHLAATLRRARGELLSSREYAERLRLSDHRFLPPSNKKRRPEGRRSRRSSQRINKIL